MPWLTSLETSLHRVLEEHSRLVIPVFQRPYEWTEANIDSFVDKLNQAAKDGDDFYFMNNIILLEDSSNETHIIDGQQRLVSYFLMLCAYNFLLLERFEDEARKFCKAVQAQADGWRDDAENFTEHALVTKTCLIGSGNRFKVLRECVSAKHDMPSKIEFRNSGDDCTGQDPMNMALREIVEALNDAAAHVKAEQGYVRQGFRKTRTEPQTASVLKGLLDDLKNKLDLFVDASLIVDDDDDDNESSETLTFIADNLKHIITKFRDVRKQSNTKYDCDEVGDDEAMVNHDNLDTLMGYMMDKVVVMCTTTKCREMAFKMFESCNTTGKPLAEVDVLKCGLYASAPKGNERHVDSELQKWNKAQHEMVRVSVHTLKVMTKQENEMSLRREFPPKYTMEVSQLRPGSYNAHLTFTEFMWHVKAIAVGSSDHSHTHGLLTHFKDVCHAGSDDIEVGAQHDHYFVPRLVKLAKHFTLMIGDARDHAKLFPKIGGDEKRTMGQSKQPFPANAEIKVSMRNLFLMPHSEWRAVVLCMVDIVNPDKESRVQARDRRGSGAMDSMHASVYCLYLPKFMKQLELLAAYLSVTNRDRAGLLKRYGLVISELESYTSFGSLPTETAAALGDKLKALCANVVKAEERLEAFKLFFEYDAERNLYEGERNKPNSFSQGSATTFALLAVAESQEDHNNRRTDDPKYSVVEDRTKVKGSHGNRKQFKGVKNGASVEHMLPQSAVENDARWKQGWKLEDKKLWIHRLGNLAIVEAADNSAMGDHEFAEKKERLFKDGHGYDNSGYRLTWALNGIEKWDKEECKKRHNRIVELLKKRWGGPDAAAGAAATSAIPMPAGQPTVAPSAGPMPVPASQPAAVTDAALNTAPAQAATAVASAVAGTASSSTGPHATQGTNHSKSIFAAWENGILNVRFSLLRGKKSSYVAGTRISVWPNAKRMVTFSWTSPVSNVVEDGPWSDRVYGYVKGKIKAKLNPKETFDKDCDVKTLIGLQDFEATPIQDSQGVGGTPHAATTTAALNGAVNPQREGSGSGDKNSKRADAVKTAVEKMFSSSEDVLEANEKAIFDAMGQVDKSLWHLWMSKAQINNDKRPKAGKLKSFLKIGRAEENEAFFDRFQPPCKFKPPDDPDVNQHAGGKGYGVIVRKVCVLSCLSCTQLSLPGPVWRVECRF